ncbi:MAG: CU044_2847 family protein [Anaerolineales bacterium]
MAKDKKTAEPVAPKPVFFEYQVDEGEHDELSLEAWQERSDKSMEQVVASLQEISRQVVASLDELPEDARPAEMNLWFGINSHAEAGAVVAFNPKKATFSARMVWYQKEKPVVSLRQTPGLIPPAPSNDDTDEE